jgi:SAM-dependent methyltransferase
MLEQARAKAPAVGWVQGQAEALPFGDGAFDGVLGTLTIHHWSALGPAFGEAFRVLGGQRFVLLTAAPEQLRRYWLNAYFPTAMARAIRQMPDLDQVVIGLHGAGFRAVRTEPFDVRPDLQDLFLYSGKQRPALYLDPRVRAGISTFANLADSAEVAAGCEQLARDLDSGRIDQVIADYRHSGGDYLFVVAER